MTSLHFGEQIGAAWRSHREGDDNDAIRKFDSVIATSPDSVDAHYGLGLALKSAGDNDAAIAAFQKALQLTEQALSAVQTASLADGHHGGNDLETNFDDRYMMLTRMISQRLDDLGAAP